MSGKSADYEGRQLSDDEVIAAGLSPALKWYDRRCALFKANSGPTLYTVAFDAGGGKGSKRFGSVNAPDEYLSLIQSVNPDQRCGYEVVHPNVPSKIYIDLEAELPFAYSKDPTINKANFDAQYAAVVEELTEYLKPLRSLLSDVFGINPNFVVLQSCRLKSKNTVFKISFHVICTSVMFNNNPTSTIPDNSHRKTAMIALINTNVVKPTKNFHPDLKVYSVYQCMRLPLAIKKGEPHGPLTLVPQLCDSYAMATEQELLLSALLTRVEPGALIVTNAAQYPKLVELGGVVMPAKRRPKSVKRLVNGRRERSPVSPTPASPNHYSLLLKALQELLWTTSDTSSRVQSVTSLEHEEPFKLKVELRNNGPRTCYTQVFKSEVHQSNNAVLFLSIISDHKYDVKFHCHANSCKGSDRNLGTVFKKADDTWDFQISCKLVYPIGASPRPMSECQDSEQEFDIDEGRRPPSSHGTPSDFGDDLSDIQEGEDDVEMAENESCCGDGSDVSDGEASDERPTANPSGISNISTSQQLSETMLLSSPQPHDTEDDEEMEDSDGDQTTNEYIAECVRELLLTAPLPWDSPETATIFALYKKVNPLDAGGALREWARRLEKGPTTRDVESRLLNSKTSRKNPLTGLHAIRMKNPVMQFSAKPKDPIVKKKDSEDDEDEEQAVEETNFIKPHILMPCIKTKLCSWVCCTRVLKQVYPENEAEVLSFVQTAYLMHNKACQIQAVWLQDGSFPSDQLKEFIQVSLCTHGLINETIPRIYGVPVRKFGIIDENRTILMFTLDTAPKKVKYLFLATGIFVDCDMCIKLDDRLFENHNADAAFANLVSSKGKIRERLRLDEEADRYRLYKPSNGVWGLIDETEAVVLVAEIIDTFLQPMLQLQKFRESMDPRFNRQTSVVKPSSQDVREKINTYTQKTRNAKDVLNNIKSKITFKFEPNKYPSLLGCFTNGIVDLTNGQLLGPAPADYGFTHSIPHAYDPDVNTDAINDIMQSFWPEACYPGDSQNICRFYQMWKGYSSTAHLNIQRALFLLGRGSNGKSVLNRIDLAAWGQDMYRNISMSALSQEGSGNNDHLFDARNSRSVGIVENTQSGQICEENFKKIVGGDPIDISKKYEKGIQATYYMKMTFMLNDPPAWSNTGHAIARRIWYLPMLAQRLEPDDEMRKVLESEGKSKYIFDLDSNFLDNIIKNHIPAYINWCVQGAVMYFANGREIMPPKTIAKASILAPVDIVDLFTSFLNEYFIRGDSKSIISVAEIKEVFLIKEEMDTNIDTKTDQKLNKALKNTLIDAKVRNRAFEGCKSLRVMLPSRNAENDGYRKTSAYSFIAWAPGPIACIVNDIRSQYTRDTRPRISDAPLNAEEVEEDHMETVAPG